MEPNDLVAPESSSSSNSKSEVGTTTADSRTKDQDNHQLHHHQPFSRKSLLSPSVKQARIDWKSNRNSIRSSLSSIPGVTHVNTTRSSSSGSSLTTSPRQRQRRVSGLRRTSQRQEGSEEGYQKFRINTINVIIDADNEEGEEDLEIAQTETSTEDTTINVSIDDGDDIDDDTINVNIDDGDDEDEPQGSLEQEEHTNVPQSPPSLATTLVEAHLVSDLEGQQQEPSLTDAPKSEKEDPILIQDAVPLHKSPWFRQGRIFTTVVMFAVLIILIIIVVVIVVTAKVDGIQQQTATANSNANNNEPNIFDANYNNNTTGSSCPTSFNNVESTCALFLNGMSNKDRTECQCMNFCNGAYVGCQDDSSEQQQQHFSCSGSAVAGCKSSIPPITLLLDAQQLDSLTLLALTDPESPQSQAYHWLDEHPQVHDMTAQRKLQLFALATLYKSTQPWEEHALEQWMDYDINECDWMTRNVNTPSRIWEYGADCTTLDEGQYYQSIDIDEAGLDGILPLELYLLTHLSYISLWSNNLRGTLSSEIGLLTQLTHLHLAKNYLTGTLPTELGLLTKLTYLDVQTNGLKGTLPSQIGSLTELTLLSLHNNNLSGELPTKELAKLTKLNEIEIYDNQLSGSLPESFCYDFPHWTTGITVDCAGKTAKCPPCPNDFTKCHCK